MQAADQTRVLEILGEALELPAAEQASFLDNACGPGSELRAQVERLLGFAPAAEAALPTSHSELLVRSFAPPQQIGRYKVIRELGHGGMGAVYLGMQHSPVKRTAAIKLLLPGMDSHDVLSRFEAERQALAAMSHPNVAVFFDAGATDTGRPYFAMEFVDGLPITRYCDEHRLTTRQRIELLIQVCEGVQHAHQKAIIHRDLKPTNVLVKVQGGKPIPTVIDFGIAKALDRSGGAGPTLFTERGQLVGTPEYMSPEQADGSPDIDTRTDVYSLGVMLYELLAGVLPFEGTTLRQSGHDGLRRIIREVEPPKPSTRFSTVVGQDAARIAQARQSDPHAHRRQLRGELDWITMRAIEKDRARRYDSPAELAADLSRYLRDEPVLAGPPSTIYRTRKFVRRHRTVVAAGALLLVSLLFGLGATAWQARVARNEREVAQNRLRDIRKLAGTLIFDIDDAIQTAGPTKAREQLVETARKYLDQLARESNDDSAVPELIGGYLKLGNVQYYPGFSHLGRPADAAESYARALELAERRAASKPADTMARAEIGRCCIYYARALAALQRHDEALARLAAARAVFESLAKSDPSATRWPRNIAIVLDHSSNIYHELGQGTHALNAVLEAERIYEQLAAAHPDRVEQIRDVHVIQSGVAVVLMNLGLPADAAGHARRSVGRANELTLREPANVRYRHDVTISQQMLAHTLLAAGFGAEPMKLMPAVLERYREALKADASDYFARRNVATALRHFGDALHTVGRSREAIAAQSEAVSLLEELIKVNPDDSFVRNELAIVHRSLALMCLTLGDKVAAIDHARQAVDLHRKLMSQRGGAGLSVSNSERVLAESLLANNDVAAAIEHARAAATFYAVPTGKPPPPPNERREYVFVLTTLGESLLRSDDVKGADAALSDAISLADAILKIASDDLTIGYWRARALLSRARLARASDMAADAERTARALCERDPSVTMFRQLLEQVRTLVRELPSTRPASRDRPN